MSRALHCGLVAALVLGLLPTISQAGGPKPSSKNPGWCGTPGPINSVRTRLLPRERRQIKEALAKKLGPDYRWDRIRIGNPTNLNAGTPVLGVFRVGGMAEATPNPPRSGPRLETRKLFSYEASKVIYPNAKFQIVKGPDLMQQARELKP